MKIEVLDHGYVELIEAWGSDERIIESARMSTGKGFLGWGPTYVCGDCGVTASKHPATEWEIHQNSNNHEQLACGRQTGHTFAEKSGDEKLLAFLWKNAHATPFEMAGAIIEVQAPIMVFREWHRHRTQSYNELSARYTPLPDVNYVPTVERLMMNSKTNKQAGVATGAGELTESGARMFQTGLKQSYADAEQLYRAALSSGVPKELARLPVPVGRYSRMRASANLRNWLAFLTLRTAPNAQWEIRQYAGVVRDMLSEKFPRTLALWKEGRTYD